MRYLGGKKRQAPAIVDAIRRLRGDDFSTYIEPFCGAMWSAVAVIKAFPGKRYVLNDANPYLMCFWKAAIYDGWDPPANPTEADWVWYKERKPPDDPMSGYLGFAWSFGGKFFGGAARQSVGGEFKGSHGSTLQKLEVLRDSDVELLCVDYRAVSGPPGAVLYADPPYEKRTPQSKVTTFDREAYFDWAERKSRHMTVLATEFVNRRGWPVLHDYGDTVVRHLNGKPPDGTRELLLKVRPNHVRIGA